MMPSPSDLQYFMEVAATRNLSRAAERIGISQPSLTLAMQRLEDTVGIALLIRSKRGVQLTAAGNQLLSQARSLLQQWELVRSDALATKDEVRGRFTMGIHQSVALYTLPHVMPHLLKKYPHLQINFSHQLSRKVSEAVISSDVDMGVVVNPVNHPDLVIRKLGIDEVTLWKGKSGDKSEASQTLICDPNLLQSEDIIKRLKGAQFKRTIETSSLELIAELTASGCGVGILPSRVAKLAHKSLVRITHAPAFKDQICFIYRADRRSTPAVQVVGDELLKFFNN